MKRLLLALALALALVASACGDGDDVAYAPAHYGWGGSCYYVMDPVEVIALQHAGYCQGWAPYLMPLWWHARYAAFYDSPAYYSVYVGSPYRTAYVQRVTVFEHRYSSEITRQTNYASWKGSDGKPYSGSTVAAQVKSGKASFGGGSVRSSGYSSGSVRKPVSNPGSNPGTKPVSNPKPGGGNPPAARPPAPPVRPPAPPPPARGGR